MNKKLLASILLGMMGEMTIAQNINMPIIQTKYTADPAPYVYEVQKQNLFFLDWWKFSE